MMVNFTIHAPIFIIVGLLNKHIVLLSIPEYEEAFTPPCQLFPYAGACVLSSIRSPGINLAAALDSQWAQA